MIRSITQIHSGEILLDASVFVATLFTDDPTGGTGSSHECFYLLEKCKNSQVYGYVSPDTVTRLWKILAFVSMPKAHENALVLPQNPEAHPDQRPVERMIAFSQASFHIMRISSISLERAVTLWEQTGAHIEACLALSAFQEFAKPPFIVVTVNDHFDKLVSNDVLVLKPADVRAYPPQKPSRSTTTGSKLI